MLTTPKASKEPHLTTKRAIDFIEKQSSRSALDIGAGNGRDSKYLATHGFDVTAVDISVSSLAELRCFSRIRFVCSDVRDLTLGQYDLINASLVLPFLEKHSFLEFWPRLLASLNVGGVVCGHFFGAKDWKCGNDLVWAADRETVVELLSTLNIKELEERLARGPNESGETVQKHNFSFIAKCIATY
jgi:SAM-dependent methyltransferase